MYVFHDGTGAVTHTAIGKPELVEGFTNWIEVPDQTFGTLAGLQVVNGQLVYADLAEVRRTAIAEVNDIAGQARRAMITWIPGQEMLYLAKEAEARAWQADPAPVLADYPLISAEIGITAATAGDLAALWLTMGAQWRAAAAQIETARLGTVKAIEDAADKVTIDAALAAYRGVMGA